MDSYELKKIARQVEECIEAIELYQRFTGIADILKYAEEIENIDEDEERFQLNRVLEVKLQLAQDELASLKRTYNFLSEEYSRLVREDPAIQRALEIYRNMQTAMVDYGSNEQLFTGRDLLDLMSWIMTGNDINLKRLKEDWHWEGTYEV